MADGLAMGFTVEVNVITVSVCIAVIVFTVICELFICRPLFTSRLYSHEHRQVLRRLVLLFAGVGIVPVLYSAGFFAILLLPWLEIYVDPALHVVEAIALLFFWHILVALAGGDTRAAMCVETSPLGAACVVMPFVGECAFCRFRGGDGALRFWHWSVAQWIVFSPVVRVMSGFDSVLVRRVGNVINVVGLAFLLRALLDTHRATRHAAPRHARPDLQFIAVKLLVFVLLVQGLIYSIKWPPDVEPPEGVTRAFALLTVLEMVGFALLFAWTFGPHTLWWALDKTQLTAALTEYVADPGGSRMPPRGASHRAGTYSPVDDASLRRVASAGV